MKFYKKIFFFTLMILLHSLSLAQETITLICQDSQNSNNGSIITVDIFNRKVIGQNFIENYVDENLIVFTFKNEAGKFRTVINRATGKYTVTASNGRSEFSFGGECFKKTTNKF